MAKKNGTGNSRVSKVKQNNQKSQKRNKLSKQVKLKSNHSKNRQPFKKNAEKIKTSQEDDENSEVESDHGEGMLGMMDDDDLAFLQNAATNRSYSMLKNIRYDKNAVPDNRKKRNIEENNDDLEENYDVSNVGAKKSKLMLPIKTKHGLVRREVEADEISDPYEKSAVKDEKEDDEVASEDEYCTFQEDMNGLELSEPVSTARLLAVREATLQKTKFLIGVLASGILEAPEAKEKNFKRLLDMLDNPNPEIAITVRKLVSVSLLEVFKDLLPSYQIRPIEETGIKLKKGTLMLQNFEKSLLKNYRTYLQKMEKMASILQKKRGDSRVRSLQEIKLGELAITCLCELLVMHPYFNFSKNLAQLLVVFLNSREPTVRKICAVSFRKVFKEDKKGEITLHIVRRINHMIKAKSHAVHCEVLSVLIALRIKDVNLDKEKEYELKQKKFMNHKQKLLNLSKKERKRSKRLDELEKEMNETKAEENKQSKQQNLTEITKIVFTIYFRILKKDPSSKLLSTCLEGLAKFSHCINLEFYHDLVNVLDQLMDGTLLGYREQLHCIQTVFTILSGQGDVLTIDPLRFYTHLYRNLLQINGGRNHADLMIALKTLDVVLVRRMKKVSQQRLLAFTKRLSILSMQVLHNGALGCLAIIKSIMQLNRSVDVLLDCDSTLGQGTYYPDLDDPEYCNASNSALWELTAMQRHYHPTVRSYATNILYGMPASGQHSVAPEFSKLSSEALFNEFDPSEVKFNPAVRPLKKGQQLKSKPRKETNFHSKELQDEVNNLATLNNTGSLNFYSDWSRKVSVKNEANLVIDSELKSTDNVDK